MDVERIIDDIEQLQEMFEAPDTVQIPRIISRETSIIAKSRISKLGYTF